MLAIDVGNTHITFALFDGPEIREIYRVSTGLCLEGGSFSSVLGEFDINVPEKIVISSVCEPTTRILLEDLKSWHGIEPVIVDRFTDMGIVNSYETAETLGVDRLVNAAAAYALYSKEGRPVIVVDAGTSTTMDFITGTGEFLGGVIAPGILSAYKGLRINAPALPEIEIQAGERVIGRSTSECMKSGVIMSHVAMVREMTRMMALEEDADPEVIVTGGLASVMRGLLPAEFIIDPELTLKGLKMIYDRLPGIL